MQSILANVFLIQMKEFFSSPILLTSEAVISMCHCVIILRIVIQRCCLVVEWPWAIRSKEASLAKDMYFNQTREKERIKNEKLIYKKVKKENNAEIGSQT